MNQPSLPPVPEKSSPTPSGANPAVTREMVHQRTLELTARAGREPREVRQIDYEQAKRELTGEVDGDRQQAVLDAARLADDGAPQASRLAPR